MSFEISPSFKTIPCSEYCLRIADGTHDSPKESSTGKLLVTSKNVKGGRLVMDSAYLISDEDYAEINRRSKVDQWDLLLTMIGTVGEVCIVEQSEPSFAIKNVGLLKCGSELRVKWLYYFFRSPQGQALIEQRKKGSTQQYISLKEIRNLPVSYPVDETEVRTVVSYLAMMDDRISLLRETNTTLEAIAQALFKSWFVDFDPVHAKQQGRAPEGMDAQTAALFPDSFEASELGMVPKGWKIRAVEDFAERVGMGPFGSNIKVETFVEAGIPVISGQHLKQYLVEDNTFNFITEEHAARLEKSCVHEGDVIFTHAGSIGQVSLLHKDAAFKSYVLSQRQFYLRCRKDLMSPEWIVLYFKTPNGQHQLLANTSQVGVPSIARPVSYLRSIKLVVPPTELIQLFASTARSINDRVMANRKQFNNLSDIRDTLLPRLISGQLRLPEAQAAVEGAL